MSVGVAQVPLISLIAAGVLLGVTAALLLLWRRDVVRQRRAIASFRSSEEFFRFVEALLARLEHAGHRDAAAELRDGLRCLNGLTDGAAGFLDAIDKVKATAARRFAPEDREALAKIRERVYFAVYRR